MMKKRIIISIIVLILVFVVYQGFFKKEKPTFTLAEVVRGTVSQEVSETGQVKQGDEIKLAFKNAGKIEKIYVTVGEEVKEGDVLAKLETGQLALQLQEARAALSLSQAQLNKLLAGASQEEIQLAQTVLNNAYKEALNYLNYAYLKTNDAFLVVSSIQRTYFTANDPDSLAVKEIKEKIENANNQIKSAVDKVQNSSVKEEIDSSLSNVKSNLTEVINDLITVRNVTDNPVYRGAVSSTDKTSLDTQISNINTAKSQIFSTEGTIKKAGDELAIKKASPRQEDVDYYQAQVDKARAQIQILESQIRDAALKSPVAGQITGIEKRTGELTQPLSQDVVIALLPAVPFEITTDIYEEDVVKISVGNEVEISLVAFPEKNYKGKIISIEPAEKLIEGVVYYEVRITFEEVPEGVKPGMTADLLIKTAQRENVLIIPEDALQEKDGKTIVEIPKENKTEEREVGIGLRGSNNIEVISGLKEGEKVIIR